MRWQQESIKISVVMYRKEYLLFIYFKLTDILYISYSQPISNKTEGVTQQLTCTWATASVVLETPERARERERARPRARAGGERYVIRNYSITVQKNARILHVLRHTQQHSNTQNTPVQEQRGVLHVLQTEVEVLSKILKSQCLSISAI
jgi:hypothetical protein